jgi:acetyl esterase/lipase
MDREIEARRSRPTIITRTRETLMKRRSISTGLFALLLPALLLAAPARAQQSAPPAPPPAQPLWAGGAPGAKGDSAQDRPTLTAYPLPAGRGSGAAVVILPGGGYQHLAMEKEGYAVARWLNTLGIAAFVVQYRLGPTYHHPSELMDAQRAIRTVRSRAAQLGIDPAKIGIMGFSAGGHLASTAGTHFDAGNPRASDPIDRASSRPDFMILGYPVITLKDPYAHKGSRTYLLGANSDPALVASLSNETQVTKDTPPTFLVHTSDDSTVPVENSILFYQALHRAGVPAELHIFETGPHGFGLGGRNPVLSTWPFILESWLRARGLTTQGGPDAR